MNRISIAFCTLISALVPTSASAAPPDVRTRAELGFLDVLSHKIQFGTDGTYIDYVKEGGQDVLFGFARLSLDLFFGRHSVTLLYQPLSLDTQVTLTRDLVIDDETFAAGTVADFKYGFPFYRVSYMYDVARSQNTWVALGGSLQLRNATIVFTSVDGAQRRLERNVGPVPILKARVGKRFDDFFVETEVDGFYAPIKYINGDNNDVVGAIVDWSLRAGWIVDDKYEVFANGRWLGGGAEGTSDQTEFGDGFTRNWLHFATVTMGFGYLL